MRRQEGELWDLRPAQVCWDRGQCRAWDLRGRENLVASPDLRDLRDYPGQHHGYNSRDHTWGPDNIKVSPPYSQTRGAFMHFVAPGGNIILSWTFSDQGGEARHWGGSRVRELTTRTGWRIATDPGTKRSCPADLKQWSQERKTLTHNRHITHNVFDHSDQKTISGSWLSTINFSSLTISLMKTLIKTTFRGTIIKISPQKTS